MKLLHCLPGGNYKETEITGREVRENKTCAI